jgi:hypothetical protein
MSCILLRYSTTLPSPPSHLAFIASTLSLNFRASICCFEFYSR